MLDRPPKMLSPGELALAWQCSTRTVLRSIRRGELAAVRLSRKTVLISEIDAAAFYAARRTGLSLSSIGSIRPRGGRPWGT